MRPGANRASSSGSRLRPVETSVRVGGLHATGRLCSPGSEHSRTGCGVTHPSTVDGRPVHYRDSKTFSGRASPVGLEDGENVVARELRRA